MNGPSRPESPVGVQHVEPLQNPYVPHLAEIVEKRWEAPRIFTYRLRFRDEARRRGFRFAPGQFNMIYTFGVGEVPISIVSDPEEGDLLDHTIRVAGDVTGALDRLDAGDVVGLRGPYGSGWPLEEARGKDVVLVTGGLGCAPVVSVINYITKRRESYGALKILHGIKTPKDLLYRERFQAWGHIPNTEVHLTSDQGDGQWRYHIGVVTNLFRRIVIDTANSLVMMCGPETMMRFAVRDLLGQGLSAERIFLSLERNMKCAVVLCGHCQYGPTFVCREGPVYRYDRIQPWFEVKEI